MAVLLLCEPKSANALRCSLEFGESGPDGPDESDTSTRRVLLGLPEPPLPDWLSARLSGSGLGPEQLYPGAVLPWWTAAATSDAVKQGGVLVRGMVKVQRRSLLVWFKFKSTLQS